ncbi:DNA gyrase subunit A [compost metagenome]
MVGRNTQGVTLIRTAEDENVVGLQRVAEPVEDEELDSLEAGAEAVEEDATPLDEGDDDSEAVDDAEDDNA